jgi:hypothetical protein
VSAKGIGRFSTVVSLFAVRYIYPVIADLLMLDREKAVERLNRSPLIYGAFRVADISDLVSWERLAGGLDDEIFKEIQEDLASIGAVDVDPKSVVEKLRLDPEGFYIARFEDGFDPAYLAMHVPEGDIFYAEELGYWFIQNCGYASDLRFYDTLEEAVDGLIAFIKIYS